MGIAMDAANALEAAIDAKIAKAAAKRTRASGTVTSIGQDGTPYVKLDGSDIETPTARTSAAVKPGQRVGVVVDGGEMVIEGNYSAPATDDGKALEAWEIADDAKAKAVKAGKVADSAMRAADEAGKVAEATEQHFWHDTNGVHVTEAEGDATTEHNILMNSLGILLRKALNNLVSITASAISFFDGSGNTAQHVTASFGGSGANLYANGSLRQKTDADGSHYYVDVNNSAVEVLSIGATDQISGLTMASLDFYGGKSGILAGEDRISLNGEGTSSQLSTISLNEEGPTYESRVTVDSLGRIDLLAYEKSGSGQVFPAGFHVEANGKKIGVYGNLETVDYNLTVRNWDSDFDRDGANPSAAIYGKEFRINDKDGERVGFVRANRMTDGTMQMQFCVANENTSSQEATNYLILGINRSGTRSVQFAESGPWRTALGLDALVKVVSATSSSISIAANSNHTYAPTLTIPSGYTLVAPAGVQYTANNANLSTGSLYKYSATQIAANVVNHGTSARNVTVTTYGLCVKTTLV